MKLNEGWHCVSKKNQTFSESMWMYYNPKTERFTFETKKKLYSIKLEEAIIYPSK